MLIKKNDANGTPLLQTSNHKFLITSPQKKSEVGQQNIIQKLKLALSGKQQTEKNIKDNQHSHIKENTNQRAEMLTSPIVNINQGTTFKLKSQLQ